MGRRRTRRLLPLLTLAVLLGLPLSEAHAEPAVSLSQTSAKPGDKVTVRGTGFAECRTVDVYLRSDNGGSSGFYLSLLAMDLPVGQGGGYEVAVVMPDPVYTDDGNKAESVADVNNIISDCSGKIGLNDQITNPPAAPIALSGNPGSDSGGTPPDGLAAQHLMVVPANGRPGDPATLWTDLKCGDANASDDAVITWGTRELGQISPFDGPTRHAFNVPAGPVTGAQPIVVRCRAAGLGTVQNASFTVDAPPVVAPPPPPPPVEVPPVTQAVAESRSKSAEDLPDPAEVFDDPKTVAVAGATAAIGLPLLGFAAELFNKTLEENRLRFRRFLRPGAAAERSAPRMPILHVIAFVLLSTAFTLGVEPAFGANDRTYALALALLVAVPLTVLAYATSAEFYRRRVSGTRAFPRLLPGALAVALVLAVLSRVLDLTPGYVYGLVLAFTAPAWRGLSVRDEGKAVALGSWLLLALVGVAWAWRIPVGSLVDDHNGDSLGLSFLENLLTQVFVAGVVGLVFGLLPLRFLDGHLLWRWNRYAWTAVYTVVLFLFTLVLLDPVGAADGVTRDLWLRALALFAGFGLFSVLFWAYFRLRPGPPAPQTPTPTPTPTPMPAAPPRPAAPPTVGRN
jgi:hypothetical protein